MPRARKMNKGLFGLGLVLVCLGLLLVFNVLPTIFATVIYDSSPPTIGNVAPPGNIYSPTPLTGGQTYKIYAVVDDYETSVTSVTCQISNVEGQSYSKTVTLEYEKAVPNQGDQYSYEWSVPSLANTKLKFVFTARDEAGNVRTKTTYGLIGTPDGYFTINGQQVDEKSKIIVNSATLNFEFHASNLGGQISNVEVKIFRSGVQVGSVTLTETSTDLKWTGTYTLPSQGTYQVNGYIWVGANSYQKMSITASWGFELPALTTTQMFGYGLIAVGAVLMFYSRKT